MSSVLIEQRIIIFSYFRIQLIDFDLRLRKIINVVLNRGSVMAFCAKIFLHESPGSRWITRIHKSQLVTPTGAFFDSRNSGESVPCREKWSKKTG